jgi:hypothetical protein
VFLWARDAACNDLEPEDADALFFPERGHGADKGAPSAKGVPWPRSASSSPRPRSKSSLCGACGAIASDRAVADGLFSCTTALKGGHRQALA